MQAARRDQKRTKRYQKRTKADHKKQKGYQKRPLKPRDKKTIKRDQKEEQEKEIPKKRDKQESQNTKKTSEKSKKTNKKETNWWHPTTAGATCRTCSIDLKLQRHLNHYLKLQCLQQMFCRHMASVQTRRSFRAPWTFISISSYPQNPQIQSTVSTVNSSIQESSFGESSLSSNKSQKTPIKSHEHSCLPLKWFNLSHSSYNSSM